MMTLNELHGAHILHFHVRLVTYLLNELLVKTKIEAFFVSRHSCKRAW